MLINAELFGKSPISLIKNNLIQKILKFLIFLNKILKLAIKGTNLFFFNLNQKCHHIS
jgi:hypothetical protein